MKKLGRWVVTVVGIGALVGYCYRGPIKDLANSFKKEIIYFFSINADTAQNIKLNTDSDSLASKVLNNIEISDDVDSPDWSMENATGEVFDEFVAELPFIKEAGDWITKNILGKEVSSEEGITLEGIVNGADGLVGDVEESIESGNLVSEVKTLIDEARATCDEESFNALLDDLEGNVNTLKEFFGEDDETVIELERLIKDARYSE